MINALVSFGMISHNPKCYHLIFSTYGTRLLGDKRGTTRWDGTRISHNEPLKEYMEDTLRDRAFSMSFQARAIAHDAIFASASKHRLYVDALNVRSSHVHLIVCALDGTPGEDVVRTVKNEVRRALASILSREQVERVWTKSFGQANINRIEEWRATVRYVLLRQGQNDYMAQTEFASRTGLTDPNNASALYDAFKVNKNAFYRANLFRGIVAEDNEGGKDGESRQ